MTLRNPYLHNWYGILYSRRTPILLERETSCIGSSQTMTSIVRWKESIGRLKSRQRGVATSSILKFEWEKKFEFKSTFPRTASHIHVLQYFVARHHR